MRCIYHSLYLDIKHPSRTFRCALFGRVMKREKCFYCSCGVYRVEPFWHGKTIKQLELFEDV